MVNNNISSLNIYSNNAERLRAKKLAMEDYKVKFELVRIRKAKGLTVADIAGFLDMTEKKVRKFEHYDSDPRQSTIRMYAHAIGVVITHNVIENYVED